MTARVDAGARRATAIALAAALVACSPRGPADPPTDAGVSPAVARAHAQSARDTDLADTAAAADADRGFVAAPSGVVRDEAGRTIWDFDAFAFVRGAAPPTVDPSLWRQALLNNRVGLFRVADRIWQLRGFDLANMTLIAGREGWIVVDALTTRETASAALAFARRHLGDRPVTALVFTHSHVDHFGGALGVLDADEARARRVPIVAPAGFMDEATRENVLTGIAMARRSLYMYGNRLPRDPGGLVDNGLGKAVAHGRIGILPPTIVVDRPTLEVELDGVRFVFHDASNSEAPAELVFHLPGLKAFCGAELMGHTLHNLYTLRGAKVRDALAWSRHLDAVLSHAAGAEVLFNQHHWPVWGEAQIREFVARQRDAYRFIHDQTVRRMNAGLTAPEIAETLQMPKSLREHLSVRGYYGTVRHNVKAVYQHYLGWYDAHPSNLDPLPPLEAGRRYVALFGGPQRLREAAADAIRDGEFRWAAELLKHAVYADPDDREARELLARAFEQMGWMAESAAWRNVYLTGAFELREGPPREPLARDAMNDVLLHAPLERFMEALAASIDGGRAEGSTLKVNFEFTDLGENWVLSIENAVLQYRRAPRDPAADATLSLTRPFLVRMMTGRAGARELLTSDQTRIDGSVIALGRFLALLDPAPGNFPIVTR